MVDLHCGATLDRQPGFRVFAKPRRNRPTTVHCRECGTDFDCCPTCAKPLVTSREEGVDTAIVTDLLSLAWEGAFDVAVLVSADADLIPCVERVQEKGLKVVNATGPGIGYDLAKSCWASFDIATIAPGSSAEAGDRRDLRSGTHAVTTSLRPVTVLPQQEA